MAGNLEMSVRTIYRDVAAIQATRIPVEGDAGIRHFRTDRIWGCGVLDEGFEARTETLRALAGAGDSRQRSSSRGPAVS